MKISAMAAFAVTGWDEKTWDGQAASAVQGEKLTQARVTYTYSGDLDAHSLLEYLMAYRADGTGVYTGLERVEGSLLGRAGSFILEISGTFDANGVRGEAVVVPNSGSGALQGLSGYAHVDLAGHQEKYPILFELDLE